MTTLPIAEVQATSPTRLSARISGSKQGRRSVVLLSAEDYDSIMETLEILGDQSLMAEIRDAEAADDRGDIYSLDDVVAEMRQRGRLPK